MKRFGSNVLVRGSPPRLRGILLIPEHRSAPARFTPAPAGNTVVGAISCAV